MRKFLIASHGLLAGGARSSLDIILGSADVFVIQAYTDENKSIQPELEHILEQIAPGDELVVFTDLMGGSVTNQVLEFARKENVHIVSGFNLPLLLDILLADAEAPVENVIESGIANAKEQIVYVNKLLKNL